MARSLLSPSPHSQSSGHGRDVPPSWPEGPEDIKGTNPCFVLASFQSGEKQNGGRGHRWGTLHGLHPTGGGWFHQEVLLSVCEHEGLRQGKGESPALPHVLAQWGPKKCSHFPFCVLCSPFLLGYGDTGSAEIQRMGRSSASPWVTWASQEPGGRCGGRAKGPSAFTEGIWGKRCPMSTAEHPRSGAMPAASPRQLQMELELLGSPGCSTDGPDSSVLLQSPVLSHTQPLQVPTPGQALTCSSHSDPEPPATSLCHRSGDRATTEHQHIPLSSSARILPNP